MNTISPVIKQRGLFTVTLNLGCIFLETLIPVEDSFVVRIRKVDNGFVRTDALFTTKGFLPIQSIVIVEDHQTDRGLVDDHPARWTDNRSKVAGSDA